MRGVRVLLLGQGRLEFDGQPLTRLMASKHQALVFYLAATIEPVLRSRLATLLWGDNDEAAAHANLRVALTRLRRWLPDMLDIDNRQVAFAADAKVSVDWRDLTQALQGDAPLAAREAAALAWRGPLLDGLDVAGSDEFEHWLALMRQRAQRDAITLRRELLQSHEADGALDAAIGHARGLLEIDEADEPAHMALMRLLAARGQRTAALAQYDACRAALVERLGARPSAACYALYTHIHADPHTASAAHTPAFEVLADPPAADAPPLVTPAEAVPSALFGQAAPVALPSQPTPQPVLAPAAQVALIGRDSDLALLNERLSDPECRWLTVTGPGGVGKTRLAMAAAATMAPRLRHGVLYFSGRDAGGVLRDAETLAQQVLEHVGTDRHEPGAVLLVLDNLETVDGVRALAPMLASSVPGAIVLATSRIRVGGVREWLIELSGLSLQPAQGGAPASSPAAQLFAANARRLVPGFDATAQADAVERICARVGGLPLALEMAAQAVHQVGVAAVADRLDRDTALSDPDRDPDDRHHRIEWVLEDSWALLDEPARTAALRLAWLPDEVDDELARAISVEETALGTLRDHSWLQRRGTSRVAMHPLQQDFLRRRPAAIALAAEVRAAVVRHLDAALPSVVPFGDVALADAERANRLALTAACAAPVIVDAMAQCVAEADLALLATWVDRVVALLQHAHRPAEAAAVLAQGMARGDLPAWLSAGWGLRRAELSTGEGDATAALVDYSRALAGFGLGDVATGRADWASLPQAVGRLLTLRGWPSMGPARDGFERLLMRSMFAAAIYLTFTPDPMPAVRLSAMADVMARRLGRHAELRHLMASWGLLVFGHTSLARVQQWRTCRSHRSAGDPHLDTLTDEGLAVLRMALGKWSGLAATLSEVADRWLAVRNLRHEVEVRSLCGKLALYEGRLVDAFALFAGISELSLRRSGESWSAWGPIGQAEAALYLEQLDDTVLQRLFERATQVMTEMEDVDAAYTLRRQALAARLAWRRGDVHASRDAVLAGCAAAARLRHCGFWAHEGYAGLGDTLLALRRHERERGGAVPPLDQAWAQLQPALAAHVGRFPPARALQQRLRGEWARDEGRPAEAEAALKRAIALAERQGMRVELTRACEALAGVRGDASLQERAQRLWRDMRAAPVVALEWRYTANEAGPNASTLIAKDADRGTLDPGFHDKVSSVKE
jgi:DNA-binding SARP family transcriptional activator/tetratricopeptide (TPR) repeat protein